MTIARSANISVMLDNYAEASDAHKNAVDEALAAMLQALRDCGFKGLPTDDRLAEVEGVISNYLMEAGYR